MNVRTLIPPKLSPRHFRTGLRRFDRWDRSRTRSFLDEVMAGAARDGAVLATRPRGLISAFSATGRQPCIARRVYQFRKDK
jgi:hypothetical protein